MNNEQRLIIALLGRDGEADFQNLITQDLDWKYFIQTCLLHRVIQLILLKKDLANYIPPEILDKIKAKSQNVALENLNLSMNLIQISQLLKANGIEFLTYKGPTLSVLAFGNESLRQSGDLDLLIFKKDMAKIRKIIAENGGKDSWKLTPKQEKAVFRLYNEFPMLFGESETLIEFHWAFAESFLAFDYGFEEVFRNSQKVLLHGLEISALSDEDQLIVLTFHGSKHFWTQLNWICDIAGLLERRPIDWDKTIKKAAQLGTLRMLWLGLFLAKDLFHAVLPADILRQIQKDTQIQPLSGAIKKHLFDENFSGEEIKTKIYLQMRERWRDKLTYSHRLLTTKMFDSMFMPMGRPR